MAEALGVASSLIAIVTITAQSTKILYETVQSFKTHQATVAQLNNELKALGKVLESLKHHVATDGTTFLPLEFPLRQCGRACQDFKHEIDKRTKHSSSSGTSFRDWARLSYMRSSINDFTTMLAGYKSTISIALADANLRTAKVTLQALNDYKDMIQDTKSDLENHLSDINNKLQSFAPSGREQAMTVTADIERISNERDGIERCLTICSHFLEHINTVHVQIDPPPPLSEGSSSVTPQDPTLAATMTLSTVKCCKTIVTDHISLLQSLRENTEARLHLEARRPSRDMGAETERDLERLQSEVDSTKQRLAFFEEASARASSGRVHIVEDIIVGNNSAQVCTSVEDLWSVKRATAGHGSLQIVGSLPPDILMEILRGQNERHFVQNKAQPVEDDLTSSTAAELCTSTSGGGSSTIQ